MNTAALDIVVNHVEPCTLQDSIPVPVPLWHKLLRKSLSADHASDPFGKPISYPVVSGHDSTADFADPGMSTLSVKRLATSPPGVDIRVLASTGSWLNDGGSDSAPNSYDEVIVGHQVLLEGRGKQKTPCAFSAGRAKLNPNVLCDFTQESAIFMILQLLHPEFLSLLSVFS